MRDVEGAVPYKENAICIRADNIRPYKMDAIFIFGTSGRLNGTSGAPSPTGVCLKGKSFLSHRAKGFFLAMSIKIL